MVVIVRGHSTDSWIHTSHPLIVPLVHASLIWLPACLTSLWISDLLHIFTHLYLYIIHAGLVGCWAKSHGEDYMDLIYILYLFPGSVCLDQGPEMRAEEEILPNHIT